MRILENQINESKKTIRRNEKKQDFARIGLDLMQEFMKIEQVYSRSTKQLRRKFTKKKMEEWKSKDKKEVMLQIVRRKVLNAEQILQNTAKGEFTGKY